jgi:hypothetical protein
MIRITLPPDPWKDACGSGKPRISSAHRLHEYSGPTGGYQSVYALIQISENAR